jgi:hypothetical protein
MTEETETEKMLVQVLHPSETNDACDAGDASPLTQPDQGARTASVPLVDAAAETGCGGRPLLMPPTTLLPENFVQLPSDAGDAGDASLPTLPGSSAGPALDLPKPPDVPEPLEHGAKSPPERSEAGKVEHRVAPFGTVVRVKPAPSRWVFREHAPAYRAAGYQPIPIKVGTKRPALKGTGWNTEYATLTAEQLQDWDKHYADAGIGLQMGMLLPDDTILAAIDIDNEGYTRLVTAILGNPTVGKIGSKGVTYFVRLKGKPSADRWNKKFHPPGASAKGAAKAVELLCENSLCVIPPTIHPDTNQPYRWIGPSLLDAGYLALPIMEI